MNITLKSKGKKELAGKSPSVQCSVNGTQAIILLIFNKTSVHNFDPKVLQTFSHIFRAKLNMLFDITFIFYFKCFEHLQVKEVMIFPIISWMLYMELFAKQHISLTRISVCLFFSNVLDLSFDEETVVSSHSFCSDFPRNA